MEELKIAIIQLLKNIYLLITMPQLYVIIMPFIIYKQLKPFAEVSQDIKQAHIDRINNIYK